MLEGTRCNDPQAREAARAFNLAAEAAIRDYVAARHPHDAGRVTDFVSTTMSGLSAKSRSGYGPKQLLATAALPALPLPRSSPPERLGGQPRPNT